jgi:hypothetical protein
MSRTPRNGLDGPSVPVRVEPIKLPVVTPEPARDPQPERAPAEPAREPEKIPA